MKRVICLYRVSTIGQVDHDDIPMQKLACREYAATHPDWEIVDEISEKGVSGYKVSTNARDAIVEIKKRAITHQFDVLLVFMFDRLGRRDDETPFVVQWFVQQGTCAGHSTYDMQPINDAVEVQVRSFLSKLASKPREELLQMASARNTEMYKVALKQAEKEYENAQKQVTALEEEAVKALTGESALDLSVINTMIIKHRAKRNAAAQTIEEARARLEQEQMSQKETQAQIDEMLSWADCYDKANIETRHMIIARIIEKVEVRANRKIHIKFRISLDQFLGKSA